MNAEKNVLIAKCLSGNASPAEMRELITWLEEADDNRLVFEALERFWTASGTLQKEAAVDTQSAWEEFKSLTPPYSGIRGLFSPIFLKAAAVTLLFGTAVLICLCLSKPCDTKNHTAAKTQTKPAQAYTKTESPVTVVNPSPVFKKTNRLKKEPAIQTRVTILSGDSIAVVDLPDGSLVHLNRNSKLQYPEKFVSREVHLEGEAYFDVQKDGTPFVVYCQTTKTYVHGTSFNVKGNPGKQQVSVSVAEGLVEVTPQNTWGLMLGRGERVLVKESEMLTEKTQAYKKELKWWKDRSLRSRFKKFVEKVVDSFR